MSSITKSILRSLAKRNRHGDRVPLSPEDTNLLSHGPPHRWAAEVQADINLDGKRSRPGRRKHKARPMGLEPVREHHLYRWTCTACGHPNVVHEDRLLGRFSYQADCERCRARHVQHLRHGTAGLHGQDPDHHRDPMRRTTGYVENAVREATKHLVGAPNTDAGRATLHAAIYGALDRLRAEGTLREWTFDVNVSGHTDIVAELTDPQGTRLRWRV